MYRKCFCVPTKTPYVFVANMSMIKSDGAKTVNIPIYKMCRFLEYAFHDDELGHGTGDRLRSDISTFQNMG